MFRIKTYQCSLAKGEQHQSQGVMFEIGIRTNKGVYAEQFLLNTAMLDGPPVAVTNEIAKSLNIRPVEQTHLVQGNNQAASFFVGYIDLVFDDLTIRQVPCVIGAPVNMIGFEIFCLMNIQFDGGRAVKVTLNERAIAEAVSF